MKASILIMSTLLVSFNSLAQWTNSGGTITGSSGLGGTLTLDLVTGTYGSSVLSLSPNTGGLGIIKVNNYGGNPNPLTFQTNSLDRMRIDGNGIVTVGTTGSNSQNLFQVNYSNFYPGYGASIKNSAVSQYGMTDLTLFNDLNNNASSRFFLTPSTYANSVLSANATGIAASGSGGIVFASSNLSASIRFVTANTQRMQINADGNVGIGTATPAYKLDVNGSINATSLLVTSGNVGIGTASPDAKLTVKGTIHTNEVKVDLNGAVAPDYVFEQDYNLMSLEETKAYIDANKHLPEVPSSMEMEKNGILLSEMNMLLLKKVEELTLNLITINERLKQLEQENKHLKEVKENKE